MEIPAGSSDPLVVPGAVLAEAGRHLASTYPAEGCGWLLHDPPGWRVRPIRNVLAARHRFEMHPADLIATLREVDQTGARLAAMFHSHVDGPPTLSGADHAGWAPGGQVLYPGTAWLVAEVRAGSVVRWAGYRWRDGGPVAVSISTDGGARQDIEAARRYDEER